MKKNKATELTTLFVIDIEMIHCLKRINDLQVDMGFTPGQQKVYTVNPKSVDCFEKLRKPIA